MVSVNKINWFGGADKCIDVAAGEDLCIIKEQIISGVCDFYQCSDKGIVEAHVVTRLDFDEMVGVCFQGSHFHKYVPLFVNKCVERGFKMRVHTKNKAIVRMWQRYGFTVNEYILRN